MTSVHVSASKQYDIHIGSGLLTDTGELMAQVFSPCKVALLTDEHVAPLYLGSVEASLTAAGFEVHILILAPGEESKSMATLENILDFLCRCSLTKSDAVAALGGGVIGDAAGFAAAIYLRGIPCVQLPTTFLAAVDSSVGGKTAVNLAAGKNLAGAFWQPKLVICDTKTLQTLSQDIYADGVCEAIKYGMLGSRPLFGMLRLGMKKQTADDVIAQCVAMKADFVAEDEYDDDRRQLLNFGHTIGHAVEACSGFSISHGHAVAIGMSIITRSAWRRGLSEENCIPALSEALQNNKLPETCVFSAKELSDAAMADKKRRGGNITLILPETIGRCYRYPLPVTELKDFIQEGLI